MKITIVTPSLNSAKTIGDTLQSVLDQSVSDLVEHIVIDGGSADGTIETGMRHKPLYEAKGWKLDIFSEADEGLYHAMSKGVAKASGQVIGILNSDDYYTTPRSLSLIENAFAEDEDLDAVYGNIHYEDIRRPGTTVRRYDSAIFSRRKMLLGFQPPHPTLYCRREVYEHFGTYRSDYRISGDFDFMLRAIYHGRIKTCHLPYDLVTMRTGGATDRNIMSHLRGLWEHELAYRRNHIPTTALFDIFQLIYKLIQIERH